MKRPRAFTTTVTLLSLLLRLNLGPASRAFSKSASVRSSVFNAASSDCGLGSGVGIELLVVLARLVEGETALRLTGADLSAPLDPEVRRTVGPAAPVDDAIDSETVARNL